MANEWALTSDEREELFKKIIPNICMENVVARYSSQIQGVYSDNFTHCCICPNKNHKQGAERTPSFYFSEETKRFVCFGCSKSGNIFDFLSLMMGRPADTIMDDYIKKKDISITDLPAPKQKFPISELNYSLSVRIRDYLVGLKNTDLYDNEVKWADGIFVRFDERFGKLTDKDFDQARTFYTQILMELERRL